MDKSWKKGYKGVYKKINKNNYSSWKKMYSKILQEMMRRV